VKSISAADLLLRKLEDVDRAGTSEDREEEEEEEEEEVWVHNALSVRSIIASISSFVGSLPEELKMVSAPMVSMFTNSFLPEQN
jgi:hypothetical protein